MFSALAFIFEGNQSGRQDRAAAEVPAPADAPESAEPPATTDVPGPDWSVLNPLGGHYSARYRAEDLPLHGGAGTRVGRGEVAYSIPVTGPTEVAVTASKSDGSSIEGSLDSSAPL